MEDVGGEVVPTLPDLPGMQKLHLATISSLHREFRPVRTHQIQSLSKDINDITNDIILESQEKMLQFFL